jgi:hypothetical protein
MKKMRKMKIVKKRKRRKKKRVRGKKKRRVRGKRTRMRMTLMKRIVKIKLIKVVLQIILF